MFFGQYEFLAGTDYLIKMSNEIEILASNVNFKKQPKKIKKNPSKNNCE